MSFIRGTYGSLFCHTRAGSRAPVLVVGGGLVGTSAAVFLSWRNVPVILIDKHSGSSPHPRAVGYTPRTMELFRQVGLGDAIPQAPKDFVLRRARVESLAGNWFEESSWTPNNASSSNEYSPCAGASIAQDRLEPILRTKAIELGADVRLNTELLGFETIESADGGTFVKARLRHSETGEYLLETPYIISADGHRSFVREVLGIGRGGRGILRTVRSVLFRASLDEYLQTGVLQFSIDQPELQAFLTSYGDGRWVLIFSDDQERSPEELISVVNKAIGKPVPTGVEILATGRWELSALIADRFSSGRVFLAGDAAHTLPPNRGGYGANTGIEDAHNLAWKLAAVLTGRSAPALLDTYDAERRPIAWLRHDQIFAREDYSAHRADAKEDGNAKRMEVIHDQAMEFGQLYRSSAVLGTHGDGETGVDALPPALRPEQWAGQPGTRAPHMWVRMNSGDEAEKLSLLDLFGRGWVLIAADEGWRNAVASIADTHSQRPGPPDLSCLCVGVDLLVSPEELCTALGLGATGATLVRPDGYIAWRCVNLPSDPLSVLRDAFSRASVAA